MSICRVGELVAPVLRIFGKLYWYHLSPIAVTVLPEALPERPITLLTFSIHFNGNKYTNPVNRNAVMNLLARTKCAKR